MTRIVRMHAGSIVHIGDCRPLTRDEIAIGYVTLRRGVYFPLAYLTRQAERDAIQAAGLAGREAVITGRAEAVVLTNPLCDPAELPGWQEVETPQTFRRMCLDFF